jgi:ankyrin repeat protein
MVAIPKAYVCAVTPSGYPYYNDESEVERFVRAVAGWSAGWSGAKWTVMTKEPRTLRSDEPFAVELTAALKRGEVERLSRLLAADPSLALCVVEEPKGGGRTPLHLFADWPGHIPNAAAIVQALVAAGADLDAPAVGMWHREAPLHWAASNDDLALIDALLDAGADIEQRGSSIDGGPPLSCAVGYGQWAAARRLVERGARTLLWHEAALGLMPAMMQRVAADPPPRPEEISGAFWNACHGGQLAAAQYLLAHGADLNWSAPWSGQTPLDIAEQAGWSDVVAWLVGKGATRGKKSA